MIKQIISYQSHGHFIHPTKSWFFPSGEVGFKFLEPDALNSVSELCIKTRLNSSDSILELMMAVDAIRQINKHTKIKLHLANIPYARQDRVCDKGESYSLQVFGNLINSMGFDLVTTFEPHSQKSFDCIHNLHAIDLDERIKNCIPWKEDYMLVSPDKGAVPRVEKLNKVLGNLPMAVANKVRDPKTGQITHMELIGDVKGKKIVIFDDLIDGGKTFIELHKLLKQKGANETMLFVVHGIFSKGIECITDLYDLVVTTNTYQDFSDEICKNLKVLKIY